MFLGVDGGGTKTAFVLIDARGGIRASHVTGSVSHLSQGVEGASVLLAEGVRALLARAVTAAAQVDFAFFGLSSYGEDSAVTPRLDAMPAPLLDRRRFRCGNDMLGSWAGSLACADGISVIAGTGSMAYGEHHGRSARAGGWGELIGDEGSAYWIAREGMNLFSRMSDGRAPRGPLHSLVCERLGLDTDLDLCARVYGGDAAGRGEFAQFARLVHEAADRSDTGARAIFLRAAAELVDARRHGLAGVVFRRRVRRLGLAGGCVQARAGGRIDAVRMPDAVVSAGGGRGAVCGPACRHSAGFRGAGPPERTMHRRRAAGLSALAS
jgi:N-acetylglucosamine kinase-like BadF-type ATPase